MADAVAVSEADQLLADQVQEWSTSTNEALTISLYQGERRLDIFNPQLTYAIYGNEEVIFGYQGLDIDLSFAAHNLAPHVEFRYEEKFPAQGEIEAGEVLEPLKDFLPSSAFAHESRAEAFKDTDAAAFEPPGTRIHNFQSGQSTYEIWCSSLSEPRARQILQNMQILVPLFIEGGTILELEYDWIVDRWKVFLLYRIDTAPAPNCSPYIFAGYGTSFEATTLPDRETPSGQASGHISQDDMDAILGEWSQSDKSTKQAYTGLPSRERISQFIILPTHQKHGLGSRLYSAMYNHLTAPANVLELTVEDPNEDFDDLRDVTDLVHLRTTNETFKSLTLPTNLPNTDLSPQAIVPTSSLLSDDTRATLTKTTKIQSRQLNRLIEMQLLSTIPSGHRSRNRITRKDKSSSEHDRRYFFWRLLVKARLYAHNRDTLVQLEPEERHEKVDEAVELVQVDYQRLIDRADERMARTAGTEKGTNGHARKRVRKRSAAAAEEDDDEGVEVRDGVEVEFGEEEHGGAARKKRKRAIVEDDDGEDL